jgi:hypothetical protein
MALSGAGGVVVAVSVCEQGFQSPVWFIGSLRPILIRVCWPR